MNEKNKKAAKNMPWVTNENEFLLDIMLDSTFDLLNTLTTQSVHEIENPLDKFSRLSRLAKDHLDEYEGTEDALRHPNPKIQALIDATSEEYDEMRKEAARQSRYWRNQSRCSALMLIIRSLETEPPKPDDKEDYPEIPVFRHPESAELNRKQKLPELAAQTLDMRDRLLQTVVGQEHVVHAFAEGIFNSEVLADADTDRKLPMAVFTFAGPPGVGKTFLAETAAGLMGIPCKRFDMSEYSSFQNFEGLIGIDYFYKDAAPGKLTSYVKQNPRCLLIFDEIEKAHISTLQLFYQILGDGVLTDKFIETRRNAAIDGKLKTEVESSMAERYKKEDPRIPFKDTIIIFTSNVGRSIYEGESGVPNAAGVSRASIVSALGTEVNPVTGEPYFPAALVSRMASGYIMLFNHLKPCHLVKIAEREYERFRDMTKRRYGINVTADDNVILSLVFANGGKSDARTLRSQTGLFFRNELYKIVSIDPGSLTEVDTLEFRAELDALPENVKKIFSGGEKPEILLYTNKFLAKRLKDKLADCTVHTALEPEEALAIAAEKDISFAMIDISHGRNNSDGQTVMASMAANVWHDGKRLFCDLLEKFPDMPVYILETIGQELSGELMTSFIRAGARGKLTEPKSRSGKSIAAFIGRIAEISRQLYMEKTAADIAAARKFLSFDTAPRFEGGTVTVSLRNFDLKRSPDAGDMKDVISEADKPSERFSDVIGAVSAKKELEFFVGFLKNPKKYLARGHRFPKGILLYGRPGTGKTMLARALAGEADVAFIPAAASAFVNRYVGSGPAAVRELFKKARRYAPSIIFIDEVDTIAKQRTGRGTPEEDTLNALLAEMDGFAVDPKRPVFVLAATNYGVDGGSGIGVLDEAFMRRFDRKILIELPNTEEREQYLNLALSKIPEHSVPEDTVRLIASRSLGMSLAILSNVVETAKRLAADKGVPLSGDILTEAFEVTKFGDRKSPREGKLERTARHEAGHAMISILNGSTPAYVTIEARGGLGGYMEQDEKESDKDSFSKSDILRRIRVSLGGRAAEIVYYGREEGPDTGAGSDLAKATGYAVDMLTRYGMDGSLAVMSRETAEKSPEIMARVNEILSEELENTVRLISENRDKIDVIVAALLKRNRLTGAEIERLLK